MKLDDIFISYAREDREIARRLAGELEAKGWSVWWDREILAGQRFDEMIARALAGARCVVVLWSQASAKSRWVRDEAADALERGVLVPVLIEDVEPPLGFRSIQLADLRGWEPGTESEEHDVFMSSVAGLVEGPAAVAAAPERRARPTRSWLRYGAAAALALAIGLAGYWLVDFGDSDTATPPVAVPPPPGPQPPPPDPQPPPPDAQPPVASWQPNPHLPLAFDEEHEFYKNIVGASQGTISDGRPGRLTGIFTLESKQKLRGIKAFVLVQLLDERGNVLQEHKARTWVDGMLSVNRKKHTVNFDEHIDDGARPLIRSFRLHFVEEE